MDKTLETVNKLAGSAAGLSQLFTGKPAKPAQPEQPAQPGSSGLPKWLIPAGIGVAALVLILVLVRR